MADPAHATTPEAAADDVAERAKFRIMYVCTHCADNDPESCGHYDRRDLAVMPNGDWLCEECFEAAATEEQDDADMPCPPRYGPTPPVAAEAGPSVPSAAAGAGVTVEAMGRRVVDWLCLRPAHQETIWEDDAQAMIGYALTGLPLGPERDAALTAVLARLAEPRPGAAADTKIDGAPAPVTVSDAPGEKSAAVAARAGASAGRALREAAGAVVDAMEALRFPETSSVALLEAIVALRQALKEDDAERAALAQAGQDGDGWRDIATAPTDGTRVLLFIPAYERGEPVRLGAYAEGERWWRTTSGPCPNDAQPTMWRPLPSPPAQPGARP